MVGDTDTLLALTASLLEDGHSLDQSVLLNALVNTNGDPNAAAALVKNRATKRSRGYLDDWLSSSASTKAPRKSLAHKQAKPEQLPPITLSKPDLIAQQTPCTLHNAILPPKLAALLYYELVDRSASWKPNKWWLFDRLVESPHKTTFLVRNDPTSDIWQESAQLW